MGKLGTGEELTMSTPLSHGRPKAGEKVVCATDDISRDVNEARGIRRRIQKRANDGDSITVRGSVRLCVAETVTERLASRRAKQDLKIRLVGNHLTPGSSLERHGATMTAGGSSPQQVAFTGLLKAHVVGVGRLGSFRTTTYGIHPAPHALKRSIHCWSYSQKVSSSR